MNAVTLPPSLTHANRSYSLFAVRAELFTRALVIRQGKKRDVYALDEQTNPEDESVRTFLIVRCGGQQDTGIYRVHIGPGFARCNCSGFGRWGNCKHADALFHILTGEELVEPYTDKPAHHRHRCRECQTVWEHADACSMLPATLHGVAHTCPQCGQYENAKYHGAASPVKTCHHKEALL